MSKSKSLDYQYYLKEIWMHYGPEYTGVAEVNIRLVEEHFTSNLLPHREEQGDTASIKMVQFAIQRIKVLLDEGWQEDEFSDVMLERAILAEWLADQLTEWQNEAAEWES